MQKAHHDLSSEVESINPSGSNLYGVGGGGFSVSLPGKGRPSSNGKLPGRGNTTDLKRKLLISSEFKKQSDAKRGKAANLRKVQ